MRSIYNALALSLIMIGTASMTLAADLHGLDAQIWQTDLDQAKSVAKKSDKPLLLYWGAVWCPPCNELKEQVFAKESFKEIAKLVVPVYLDGDSENAQTVGEALKVSGYPTIVLLDVGGRELTRLSGNLDVAEFQSAVNAAINVNAPIAVLLAKKGDWTLAELQQLAYTSWDQLEDSTISKAEQFNAYGRLLGQAEAQLQGDVKAALLSRILAQVAARPKEPTKEIVELRAALAKDFDKYWAAMTTAPESLRAARGLLNYGFVDVANWLSDGVDDFTTSDGYKGLRDRWFEASNRLSQDPSLSVDTRLWSVYPRLQAAELEDPASKKDKSRLATTLRDRVRDAALQADAQAKSAFARQAVVSGAAYLLGAVGDDEAARQLLIKELRTTETPWYYESTLASLEKSLDRLPQAQYWSKKARLSAKGRASKIQWLVSDIVLQLETGGDKPLTDLLPLLDEYYILARSLSDGFSGRNAARSNRLASALKGHLGNDDLRKFLQKQAARCHEAPSNDLQCKQHFSTLVGT